MFFGRHPWDLCLIHFSRAPILYIISTVRPTSELSGYLSFGGSSLGAVPPSPALPHPYSQYSCDSFLRPVPLHGMPSNVLKTAPAQRSELETRCLNQPLDTNNVHRRQACLEENHTRNTRKCSQQTPAQRGGEIDVKAPGATKAKSKIGKSIENS